MVKKRKSKVFLLTEIECRPFSKQNLWYPVYKNGLAPEPVQADWQTKVSASAWNRSPVFEPEAIVSTGHKAECAHTVGLK
jgi:hypothetical protein